ncbi:Zinc finger MYM-type protein 1 [Linum grandiflorum]
MSTRKFESGSSKRKKKQRIEELIQSQKGERSFSKLKLLKSYLRSTMTQERLNGLAMLAIEEKFLEDGEMEELIDNFISKNTRRLLRFKQ